ncbi:MAG: metallophosphoesterase family protein [bacterium]
MKIALYSDIHAHIPQLDAIQEAVAKENADREILIGDLVMLGPEPSEVVERFRGRKDVDVLVGNLDLWVANRKDETDKPKNEHHEWLFGMTRLTRERLSEEQLVWLRGLMWSMTITPEAGHDFYIFHATPGDIEDAIPLRFTDDEVREKLGDGAGASAEIMAFGHVHGPYIRQVGSQTLLCTAAVGMNWDGDYRPAYSIVEYEGNGKWHAEVKRVEYDCAAQAKRTAESWLPHGERIAKMVQTGEFWNPAHMPH